MDELPLWMPPGQDGDAAWQADTSLAQSAGMRSRPVQDTVAATWAWMQAVGMALPEQPERDYLTSHGIDPAKEAKILAAWHARAAG